VRLDPITVVPYDPAWPAIFAAQRERITPLLEGWIVRDIEHIGSTAVPGLAAKPIIDMLAVVDAIDARPVNLLAPAGWVHAPEPFDEAERKRSYCFPDVSRRSHHLHVVEARSEGWRGWLAFRDRLRGDPEAARAYADLKRGLVPAPGHDPDDRDAYRAGKATFVLTLTEQALRESGAG
jgi:GrpB-like predicted nucleotidyltransferase (UPF0157 family)